MILLIMLAIVIGAVLLVVGVGGSILEFVILFHVEVFKHSVDEWSKATTRLLKAKAALCGVLISIAPYAWIIVFLRGVVTGSLLCLTLTGGPLVLASICGSLSSGK